MDMPLPTQTLPVSQLLSRKRSVFRFAPDAQARQAIAQVLGLVDLPELSFEGDITPEQRGDLKLTGRLQARAVQSCIVTLAPVQALVETGVLRRYLSDFELPEGDEAEIPEDDTAEPLPGQIDLAAVAIEALALALPEYPRAPGAELGAREFPAPDAAPEASPPKPLAGLAALMARKPGDSEA